MVRLMMVVSFAALAIVAGSAQAQFTFVQVELDLDGTDGCSILRVDATGALTEWVSNTDILAVSGETECDPDDTGLAVAPDGTVYFSDDDSDAIYQVSPAGVVSLFASKAALDAAVGTENDIDNGMDFGPDGNLYAADEDCDCVIQITPSGTVSVVVTNAAILAATGKTEADLEGGLSVASDGAIYFVDEFDGPVRGSDDDEEDDQQRGGAATNNERVLSASGGVVSIVATEADIVAATGNENSDMDLDIQLVGGTLYILDDSSGDIDALVAVNVQSGATSLIANANDVTPVTGVSNANGGGFDPEGGLAYDSTTGELIIGDDGFDDTDSEDKANMVRVTPSGTVSLFVSDSALSAFYEGIYGSTNNDFRLRGGLDFLPPPPIARPVPANSSASVILLVLLVLVGGFLATRRIG